MVVINEQTQDINRGRYIVAKTMAEKQENSHLSDGRNPWRKLDGEVSLRSVFTHFLRREF